MSAFYLAYRVSDDEPVIVEEYEDSAEAYAGFIYCKLFASGATLEDLRNNGRKVVATYKEGRHPDTLFGEQP